MNAPKQCAVLVGGLGTRLGSLTANTPKPLLPVGDRVFLSWVLRELCRFGIERVILLAGYKSASVYDFCRAIADDLPCPIEVTVSIEPERAGTGGAVWYARDMLDDTFLLVNGDSWFDTNLAAFFSAAADAREAQGFMLLRHMDDCSRYGTVQISDGLVTAFQEKRNVAEAGLINSGIYLLKKSIFSGEHPKNSLEMEILPDLAARGVLGAKTMDGYFIDIGIPTDYARAQDDLPARLRRPAVFFDRDGVLNKDLGWVGTRERFFWTDTARQAVRRVNDLGYHAFVVTNQAGVARGLFEEADVRSLHLFMQAELLSVGAILDDIRYCPYSKTAVREEYRRDSDWRKPEPGMLLDLIRLWDVDVRRSFLIGDKASDIKAAAAARVPGYLFEGEDLLSFLEACLASRHDVLSF